MPALGLRTHRHGSLQPPRAEARLPLMPEAIARVPRVLLQARQTFLDDGLPVLGIRRQGRADDAQGHGPVGLVDDVEIVLADLPFGPQ